MPVERETHLEFCLTLNKLWRRGHRIDTWSRRGHGPDLEPKRASPDGVGEPCGADLQGKMEHAVQGAGSIEVVRNLRRCID